MGRGSSKAGGGGGGKAQAQAQRPATPSEAFNDGTEQRNAAQALYDIPRTMAFPSNDTIVKHTPSLSQMKQEMADAPVGTTVASNFNGVYRVMEKTGTKQWTMQDYKIASDGTVSKYGGGGKYQGLKAMQMMSTVLNEGYVWNLPQALADAHRGR